MSVHRVEKTGNYTKMSNYHLRDHLLDLKGKGLLSVMLSLPDDWIFTETGLCKVTGEGITSLRSALKQLEAAGYLIRTRKRDSKGHMTETQYDIYEIPVSVFNSSGQKADDNQNAGEMDIAPVPDSVLPDMETPILENPVLENLKLDNPNMETPKSVNQTLLKTNKLKTDQPTTEIHQSTNHALCGSTGWIDGSVTYIDDAEKYHLYEETIKENVALDLFRTKRKKIENDFDNGQIDMEEYEERTAEEDPEMAGRVVRYMTDIICGVNNGYVKINGVGIPAETVKSKLMKIGYPQMKSVVKQLNMNPTIKNPKSYAISMLYNI